METKPTTTDAHALKAPPSPIFAIRDVADFCGHFNDAGNPNRYVNCDRKHADAPRTHDCAAESIGHKANCSEHTYGDIANCPDPEGDVGAKPLPKPGDYFPLRKPDERPSDLIRNIADCGLRRSQRVRHLPPQ